MNDYTKFFIDGSWVDPVHPRTMAVIDPKDESTFATISLGSAHDVERAVQAARAAFPAFSLLSKAERLALLRKVLAVYVERIHDIAAAIHREMGAPPDFALHAQAASGQAHLEATIAALEAFEFDEHRGSTMVIREAIGVCALITPWNWPINQIVCKVAPALAAGCTVILKPSEIAPISALVFAEILDAAGVPSGVFNLVNGTGPDVGQVLAEHPEVDMVSFTGSTRAGVIVAKAAAETVKRVAQELGGKSANIILADADLESSVTEGVHACFSNSGQSCDAPTRMLVPRDRADEAYRIAKAAADLYQVGGTRENDLGPLVSELQFEKVQHYINAGIEQGAKLLSGGAGKPEGRGRGYFVKPTVFGDVTPDMKIAEEEIFGPVLAILPYDDEEDAVRMANDTVFGLAAYVQSTDLAHARRVARQMRAGSVYVNYPDWDVSAPFGGYKQSGNGREYADFGIADFLEIKGIVGWGRA
ncbi:aldehyde dehydrogenase family protein [Burkholderia cepacia]|uniref:Aldehyde dehydrogenase n=1 Tax=Burkholderia cepacia GG4 TaxID=1009846 RepID=A0A9W3PC02_BURCE|nr:aldehyde dehydrogenase family protein [Burkholderia cepacia]AFQ51106.1 aldehyde dehydrogenase [Burkholderia cepacia GG4]